jgi:hypothetical protein
VILLNKSLWKFALVVDYMVINETFSIWQWISAFLVSNELIHLIDIYRVKLKLSDCWSSKKEANLYSFKIILSCARV